jgi:hypothetical protein
MDFGVLRHELFAEEARRTKRPYYAFGLDWPVSHVEEEFVTEIWPDVFIHSRMDLVCEEMSTLPDYKTALDGEQGLDKVIDGYRHETKRRQLLLYAYQLGLHGIKIDTGAFLIEGWNKERDTILRYEVMEFPITFKDMATVVLWAKKRVSLLQSVLEEERILGRGC